MSGGSPSFWGGVGWGGRVYKASWPLHHCHRAVTEQEQWAADPQSFHYQSLILCSSAAGYSEVIQTFAFS